MNAANWFREWHAYHRALHPYRTWIVPESPEGLVFYEGWVEAFDRAKVTEDQARAASRAMQSDPPGFPERHLKAVLDSVASARRESPLVYYVAGDRKKWNAS